MMQLKLPLCSDADSGKAQANQLITVFINIHGHSVTRLVPTSVYLKGWSFTRGWLKAAGEVC